MSAYNLLTSSLRATLPHLECPKFWKCGITDLINCLQQKEVVSSPFQRRYSQLPRYQWECSSPWSRVKFRELCTKVWQLLLSKVWLELRKYGPIQSLQFWGYLTNMRVTIVVKEDVSWFKVSVDDAFEVTIGNTCQHLIQIFFDFDRF